MNYVHITLMVISLPSVCRVSSQRLSNLGKKLSDVFSSEVDTGEFQEPDEMGGKLRWQVILLEPLISDHQHSTISLSDDEGVDEVTYRQGVYLEWTNTLADLRRAFIDTHQLDKEELTFCFLWSDVIGEHIDIAAESSLQLSKLGRAATRNRTVYIERVDPGELDVSWCHSLRKYHIADLYFCCSGSKNIFHFHCEYYINFTLSPAFLIHLTIECWYCIVL